MPLFDAQLKGIFLDETFCLVSKVKSMFQKQEAPPADITNQSDQELSICCVFPFVGDFL